MQVALAFVEGGDEEEGEGEEGAEGGEGGEGWKGEEEEGDAGCTGPCCSPAYPLPFLPPPTLLLLLLPYKTSAEMMKKS